MAAHSKLRLAEVVACLALTTDLATGQPLEHSLRRTLLATWLGRLAGLPDDQLRDAYYVALLGSVGCVLDSAAMAGFVEDDIEFRGNMFPLDMANPLVAMRYFGRYVGRGRTPFGRVAALVSLSTQASAICRDVALRVGGILDLGPAVGEALGQCDEHWNGKGAVLGLRGEQISPGARLFLLAQDVDVFHRLGGTEAAVDVVRRRSGTYYDPALAAGFIAHAADVTALLDVPSRWDAVLGAEPGSPRLLGAAEFDAVAHQVANFVDMRSSYTVGHSPAVAGLAEGTAHRLGLGAEVARTLRTAGLFHDLGRAGVPVALWNKPGPLSQGERDRIERHPAVTELLLARSSELGHLGTLAGLHHERLDGSGYRGVTSSSLPVTARVLAVADVYQSKLERRAYRPPLPAAAAAAFLRDEVAAGRLDAEVVSALLEVAGHRAPENTDARPGGLTKREVEVLRLVVRGMTNRDIAGSLVVAPKTVSRHLESIYAKIDVSTRVGATLFAIEHGLASTLAGPVRH